MTKLVEWLSAVGCLFIIWYSIVANKIDTNFTREHYNEILISPIILVILFGLYALSVVLFRTFTFNSCEEAAVELQKEIQEAKADLTRLGFKFNEKTR